jgi:hypothetical protein
LGCGANLGALTCPGWVHHWLSRLTAGRNDPSWGTSPYEMLALGLKSGLRALIGLMPVEEPSGVRRARWCTMIVPQVVSTPLTEVA